MIESEEISHPPDTPANVLLQAVRGGVREGVEGEEGEGC